MLSSRLLIVASETEEQRRVCEQLAVLGLDVHLAGTGAAGLLMLGHLQPDALILDPCAGRGRASDWVRALERYRGGRALSLAITSSDPKSRQLLGADADLGTYEGPLNSRNIAELLSSALDAELDEVG